MTELSIKPIGKYIDQLNGFAFKSELFNQEDSGIRLCRGINITRGKLRFDSTNEMYWNDKSLDLKKYLLDEGDIVISMDGSLVGRNFAIVQNDDLPLLLVQRVARLRAKVGLSQGFLYQWIASDHFIKYVDSVKTSSGIPHISASQINEFKITFLPYQEQQKIASILSKWDETIEAQSQLIEAKEKRKKGLMQKLLNGEVRFPGFEEDWVEVTIKDIGTIVPGGTPSTTVSEYWNGDIFWCTPTEITALKGKMYIESTQRLITEKGMKGSSANLLPINTLIVCTRATIGDCAINKVPMTTNQGFKSIIPFSNIDVKYIYYLIQVLKPKLMELASGSTFLELSKSDFEAINISLPNLSGQQKVSSALFAIDEEIQSLKSELEALKLQKKGLMQKLLTGKIRVKA